VEKELREYLKFELQALDMDKEEKEAEAEDLETEFIASHARDLNEFLPVIKGVNYHIVISDKVFDRPIGAHILEKLQEMRDDVRLIGGQPDGSYDSEAKITTRFKGLEEIRVLVPRRTPWFYRIITAFMQRLINQFIPRTFSPPPQLILAGCTGTASYLPFYEGVPCISVPTFHKIDEQISTENMVGCSVIKVVSDQPGIRIINGVYDFRPAIFSERQFAFPQNLSRTERAVLNTLIPSDASLKIINFRINAAKNGKRNAKKVDEGKVNDILKKFVEQNLVQYSRQSNRYAISEDLIQHGAEISLKSLFADSRTVKHTVFSCFHAGCLKALYYTALNYLPLRAVESDAFIENGDGIQGIAHNYDYNGELLPDAHGFDRQEILLAHIRAKNILDIFRLKYQASKNKNSKPALLLRQCLITYVYNLGNHPTWKHWGKDALILYLFETKLREQLIDGLQKLCKELNIKNVSYELAKEIVDEKIVRVGESKIVNLDGTVFGLKHPFKGRTLAKSHRIQDVVDFTWRSFQRFAIKLAKDSKGFAIADIANFHECAAVHVVKFGRTVLGLMTGAYLVDTSFESHMDKVVDYGSANMTAVINPDDRLLYSEVEFDNRIHPDDEKIVLADKIKTSDVLALCAMLNEIVDLPWRQ